MLGTYLSRRKFLSLSARAALGFALVGLPRKGRTSGIPSFGEVLRQVRQAHRRLSSFPRNPVAVAWDPELTEYPSPDLLPYDREDNPVYPLVEKALMLLSPEEPENPLSGIINPGDSVVIKPNFCTVANYPLPVTHPSVLVPIVDYAVKAGASKITIAEGPIDYRHGLLIFRRPYANIKDLISFLRAKYPAVEISFKDTNFDRFRLLCCKHPVVFMRGLQDRG